jgi:hypothetical protein
LDRSLYRFVRKDVELRTDRQCFHRHACVLSECC